MRAVGCVYVQRRTCVRLHTERRGLHTLARHPCWERSEGGASADGAVGPPGSGRSSRAAGMPAHLSQVRVCLCRPLPQSVQRTKPCPPPPRPVVESGKERMMRDLFSIISRRETAARASAADTAALHRRRVQSVRSSPVAVWPGCNPTGDHCASLVVYSPPSARLIAHTLLTHLQSASSDLPPASPELPCFPSAPHC